MIDRQFVILVVDDEEPIRILIGNELEERGFEVILASSGDHAVEVLGAARHVDLIVTDVRMPGARNGFDLIEEALVASPSLRTIVISGYSDEIEKRSGVADRFLLKPFTMHVLGKEIEKLLAA